MSSHVSVNVKVFVESIPTTHQVRFTFMFPRKVLHVLKNYDI